MATRNKQQLTLISHKLCPYVQRAVIALQELGLEYKRVDIDLENPPDWFKRLSPLGKVPLLLIDDETLLFESAVIAEYVNDIGAGVLLPTNPIEKARHRAWIEFASATLDNIGALYSATGEKSYARSASQLEVKWRQLEQILSQSEFFDGDQFSLVDAAFGPVFRYLDLFEKLVDTDLRGQFPKVTKWRRALQTRESVVNAVRPEYQTLLAEFLASRDSYLGQRAQAFLASQKAA
jgi:glutathione S-transferase